MKKNMVNGLVINFAIIIIISTLLMTGCSDKKHNEPTAQNSSDISLDKRVMDVKFRQINLVSDISYPGARIDPNLSNAWGIAVNPTGIFWISANHTGLSTVYDSSGGAKAILVTIPTVSGGTIGAPSGIVYNYTSVFKLPNGNASRFIFVGEDGIVSAWGPSSGTIAAIVADRSSQNAVYKGVEIAQNGSGYFLYAANFKQSKVDVFDSNFNLVNSITFNDPNIPIGFAPFNIKSINGMLFITYAKQKGPDNMDDEKGPGNGYIDIFTPSGAFVSRFASRGKLNSPWGITEGPTGKLSNTILAGNFGDGRINVFSSSGQFMGQLRGKGERALKIDGLWALFTSETIPAVGNKIYFTAGPNDENNGLFGYLLSKGVRGDDDD
ncbi:MAG: TIGR03118 family protein [Bacteroidota bacterium]|nr:TIGR03118 family protein [Bacteroidota bacterium]